MVLPMRSMLHCTKYTVITGFAVLVFLNVIMFIQMHRKGLTLSLNEKFLTGKNSEKFLVNKRRASFIKEGKSQEVPMSNFPESGLSTDSQSTEKKFPLQINQETTMKPVYRKLTTLQTTIKKDPLNSGSKTSTLFLPRGKDQKNTMTKVTRLSGSNTKSNTSTATTGEGSISQIKSINFAKTSSIRKVSLQRSFLETPTSISTNPKFPTFSGSKTMHHEKTSRFQEKQYRGSLRTSNPTSFNVTFFGTKQVYQEQAHLDGAIMGLWLDTCMNITTWNNRWHPLFPEIPQDTTKVLKLGDDKLIMGSLLRRIYGYLTVDKSGFYDFQMHSHEGAEVLVSDTRMTMDNFTDKAINVDQWEDVLYINLTLDDMTKQNIFQRGILILAKTDIKTIWLSSKTVYFVDIFQGGRFYAEYKLKWKLQNESDFRVVGKPNLFHTKNTFRKAPSKLWKMNPPVQKYSYSQTEQSRLDYHKIEALSTPIDTIRVPQFSCPDTNWYRRNITELYLGRLFVDYHLVYPKNYFDYTGGWPESHLMLNAVEAKKIASKVFENLNKIHNRTLKFERIVHVQINLQQDFRRYPDWWQSHYFVEIDVSKDNKLYRVSHFVHLKPNAEICFMTDFVGNQHSTINILTPIRNQFQWFEYLLKMLQEVLHASNENNVNLIIIDYNSTDGDVQSLVKQFDIKYEYIRTNDVTFNKVKALNIGLRQVVDESSIVFILDLHLQLPFNIFDRIRKFTIQNKTSFCPTLLKLQCGEHEQYTTLHESMWIDDGYGMMAMYKSDWTKVGGFNEEMFGHKWGGEDWELVDRIVGHGIYVVHDRMPRFYHIYHNNKKTWDGNHI